MNDDDDTSLPSGSRDLLSPVSYTSSPLTNVSRRERISDTVHAVLAKSG
jgi:hypothetical protein